MHTNIDLDSFLVLLKDMEFNYTLKKRQNNSYYAIVYGPNDILEFELATLH